MDETKKASIIKTVKLGFIILISIFLFFILILLHDVYRISSLTHTIYHHPLVVSNAALKSNASIAKMHRSMKDVVLFNSPLKVQQSIDKVTEEEKRVYKNLDIVRNRILGEEGKVLENESRNLFNQWRPIREEVIGLVREGQIEKAANITKGEGAEHVDLLEEKMNELTNYATKKASGFMHEAEKAHSRLNIALVSFLLIGIFTFSLVAFWVIKRTTSEEANLKESEERYRSLIENQTELVFRFTPDGRFVFVNDVFCRFFNKAKEELIGSKWQPLPVDNDAKMIEEKLSSLSPTNPAAFIENRVRSGKGKIHWFQFANKGFFDGDGNLVEIQSVGRDITERKQINDELRKERDRAQKYLDISGVMFLALNKEQHVTMINKKGYEILGVEEHEIVGKNWFDHFIKAEDSNEVKEVFDKILSGVFKPVEYFENVVLRKGGDERIIAWHNALIKDESGHITGTLSSGEDITERKLAETKLKQSEEKFRLIAESSAEDIWQLDLYGKVTYASPTVEKIFGYTPEEVLLLDFGAFFPESELSKIAEVYSKIISDKKPRLLELTGIRKHGSSVPIEVSVAPIIKDETITGFQGITRDISERKRAEKALGQSEERYRAIIENSTEGITIIQEGLIKYANQALQKMTGFNAEENIGAPITDFFHEDDIPIMIERYEKRMKGEEIRPVYEYRIKRKDGSDLDIELSGTKIIYENKDSNLIVIRDVTEKKKLEDRLQQSQKMEAIGTLTSGIAHDFNNILTSIIGNSDLALMETNEDDPIQKRLEEIKSAGELAASLVDQLLAFSRKQIVQPRVLDLNELLPTLINMLRRMVKEDIEIKLFPGSSLGCVEIDSGQLEQVIINLAINASDAMPMGGKLTIETANTDIEKEYFSNRGVEGEPGPYVMLTVSDNGTGMDKKTQEHIFEPFFTTKGLGKGTGLGLSTIYGIVKQNNGFIWVYSEPGQGSVFKIYLPMSEKVKRLKKKNHISLADLKGSETVLIVEDDDSVRNLVKITLEKYEYRIVLAQNGDEALKAGKEHVGAIHLMITDVVMPGMGGREVAQRMQAVFPQIKVLYMSGYTDNAIAHHGVLEPGLNFIEKPFSPKDMAKKVREVLDKE